MKIPLIEIVQGLRKGRTFMNWLGNIKNLGFRPSLMHISILHIGEICINVKFVSEISMYDFNMANKQKFEG